MQYIIVKKMYNNNKIDDSSRKKISQNQTHTIYLKTSILIIKQTLLVKTLIPIDKMFTIPREEILVLHSVSS
jgi:hypothetical protein